MKTYFSVLVMFVVLGSAPLVWAKNSIEITGKSRAAVIENCDFGQLVERLELISATFTPFGGAKSVSTLVSKTFGMDFDIQITNCPLEAVEKSQIHYDSVAYIAGTATHLKGFDELHSIYKARVYSSMTAFVEMAFSDRIWQVPVRIVIDLDGVPFELAEKLWMTLGHVTLSGYAEILGANTNEPSSNSLLNVLFEMPEQPFGIVLALIRIRPRVINGYDLEEIREQTYNRLLREREKNCDEIYNDTYKDVLPRSEFKCFSDDI